MAASIDYGDVLSRWHECAIPREELTDLMQRSDRRGIVRTAAFLALLFGLGLLAYFSIGTYWVIPAFLAYGTVYCFLNHLMHETHHRTVFRSLWLNEVVHWFAALAHGAEAIYDRWGHTRHHTYTYHIGRDPEVVTARPANIPRMLGMLIGIGIVRPLPILKHALGIISEADRELVPESDWRPMIWSSRAWLLFYFLIFASCFAFGTILPLMYTLFARFYGATFATAVNFTEHIGLEENVWDHRLNTRDVKMGPITTFLYWNMQWHIEHHMFPGVPFHALPALHERLKSQLPEPHPNLRSAWKDVIGVVLRQGRETDFHLTPLLPDGGAAAGGAPKVGTADSSPSAGISVAGGAEPWVLIPGAADLAIGGALPFTSESKAYALFRLSEGYFATDGRCTHSGAFLAKGLVIEGEIECPAHQGRFDIKTGRATLSPACDNIGSYPVRMDESGIYVQLNSRTVADKKLG